MPTLIIVGFGYDDLPSTITDIYRVYSFYRDLSYRIYIASDITVPQKPPSMIELLTTDTVDNGYVDFIETEFVRLRHLVSTRDELVSYLRLVVPTDDNRIIYYYTGHGANECFLLPDDSKYLAKELRSELLSMSSKYIHISSDPGTSSDSHDSNFPRSILQYPRKAQILILLDCCNPSGLYLPFKMMSNKEAGDKTTFEQINENYIPHEVILLSSSESSTVSQANTHESPFTRQLFTMFRNRAERYDLASLTSKIDMFLEKTFEYQKITQRCCAYASYPTLECLWSWVICSTDILDIDYKSNHLYIKR